MTIAQLIREKSTNRDGSLNIRNCFLLANALADSYDEKQRGFVFRDGSILHNPEEIQSETTQN